MKKNDEDVQVELLLGLNRKLEEMVQTMHKLGVAEYVEMLRHPRRLFWINFCPNSPGLGMAIGFTILAAVVLYLLQRHIAQPDAYRRFHRRYRSNCAKQLGSTERVCKNLKARIDYEPD